MNSYGSSDRGKVRAENQDSFIIENCDKRGSVIAVICDGMGGAKAGDLASQLACKAFVSGVYDKLIAQNYYGVDYESILRDSCSEANGVVNEYSGFSAEYSGMGTTLVGGIVRRREAHIVNIGDSRAYLINLSGIRQITRDHSYVESLIAMGAIDRSEAMFHPKKNIITRALGVDRTVEADYFRTELNKGDCLLLCSDGLSNMVSDREMLKSYETDKTPQDMCRSLMELALGRGARDNVTVVAVKI